MQADGFIREHLADLDDFWRRREAALEHELRYRAYGHPVRVRANAPVLLEAARLSRRRYSRCAPAAGSPLIHLDLVLDRRMPNDPPPADWPARLRHVAVGPWLTVNAAPWLSAFAHTRRWTGVALVSPGLAEAPRLLSRYVCDTFVLNMIMRTGLGLLHASCLWREGRALLLSAPHNTGKSTTALRLALHGYRLLSDGMTYVRVHERGLELLGYPVGEAKLRLDMLDAFPGLSGHGEPTLVREDTKMVFDLRRALPRRIVERSVWPREIVLCQLHRTAGRATRLTPLARDEALRALWPESSFVDDEEVMRTNLRAIRALLARARCYRMALGSDEAGILRAVDGLWAQ